MINNVIIIEKIKQNLPKDLTTEGMKQGYILAAKEYEIVLDELLEEQNQIKKIVNSVWNNNKKIEMELQKKLEKLKRTETELKEYFDKTSQTFFAKFTNSMYELTKFSINSPIGKLKMIICALRKNKLNRERERGYNQAKKIYEKKVKEIKQNLRKYIEDKPLRLQVVLKKIDEVFDDIIELQLNIAELNMLIEGEDA